MLSPRTKAACPTSVFWLKGSILALSTMLLRFSMVMASSESKMKQSSGLRLRTRRNFAAAYLRMSWS